MDLDLTSRSETLVEASTLLGDAPIIVLAPHPDDESLACGALLSAAFDATGAHVICMTDGSGSHPRSRLWPPDRLAATRKRELHRAVRLLGGGPGDVTWAGHPDGWLGAEDTERIAADIARICIALGARHLFAPAIEDHHEDHKATARIAARVARLCPQLTPFAFPVWSRWDAPGYWRRTPGRTTLALDPGPWAKAKSAAILAHATQCGRVISDDPGGFVLPLAMIVTFAQAPELYWRTPA